MISTLGNKKFKYKICKKEIETYNFKVHMENVHKGLKKYKGDECGKNFTLNIGWKGYIAAAHEKKIQLWSMWQKFGYSL